MFMGWMQIEHDVIGGDPDHPVNRMRRLTNNGSQGEGQFALLSPTYRRSALAGG